MKKKKVCIVTNYSATSNYGALLQSYALNKIVSQFDCEVKDLYVKGRGRSKVNAYKTLLKKGQIVSLLRQICADVPEYRVRKEILQRRATVEQFRMEIPHTELYYTDCFDGLNDNFGIFIAGSDQIFRPDAKTNRLVDYYWLNMVDSKKCVKATYAASMGKESLDEQQNVIAKKYLEDFDFLSFSSTTLGES